MSLKTKPLRNNKGHKLKLVHFVGLLFAVIAFIFGFVQLFVQVAFATAFHLWFVFVYAQRFCHIVFIYFIPCQYTQLHSTLVHETCEE